MANEKQIKARFQQKHDIEANWNLAVNFIPKAGEIIVYDPDANYNYSRLKIGDGVTSVNQLNFVIDEKLSENDNAIKYTEQNLTDAQKNQARTNIGATSISEVKEMLGIENEEEFSVTGEVVQLDLDIEPGTELNVVSKIHRDSTWGESNKLVLHQVSGDNFVDLSSYLGGAGKVYELNGLTATINADGTLSVTGTNTHTGWTNVVNVDFYNTEHETKVYPAGTYIIPSGLTITIRAAQHPNNVQIDGLSGNLQGKIVVPEPFRIRKCFVAYKSGASVNDTIPLGLFRGDSVPDVGREYVGNLYTVTFDQNVYEGEYNWTTGELKDADGNTVAYYTPQSIKRLPGVNYFWTCFGENTVSNVSSENLGKVVIRLGDSAPEETVPSICDFTLTPTTKNYAINVYGDARYYFRKENNLFYGMEVPLVTTRGNLIVTSPDGLDECELPIPELINYSGITDVMTSNNVTKRWSDRFYITREPDFTENIDDGSGNTTTNPNTIATWVFSKKEFEKFGLPIEATDIPIVSPIFTTVTNDKLASSICHSAYPYIGAFSYDAENDNYVFKCRARRFYAQAIYNLTSGYFCYPLKEEVCRDNSMVSLYLSAGYSVRFEQDNAFDGFWEYSLTQDYCPFFPETLKALWSTKPTDASVVAQLIDTTPNVAIFVPRSVEDVLYEAEHIAKRLNYREQKSDELEVNSYAWIGKGDGATDYTDKIQSKLTEIHNTTKGGTIYLGPGTYKISGSLIVYDNTRIIGDGQTVIEQTADNTHALVVCGSSITIEDLSIKLSGACDRITACIYVNSMNKPSVDTYNSAFPETNSVKGLTVDNVFMSGEYKFGSENGYPVVSDAYENYMGVGIYNNRGYFNYAHVDNVHFNYLYAGVYGGSGSNYFNVTSEFNKYGLYIIDAGDNTYFVNGHSYYKIDENGNYITMSDAIAYVERDAHSVYYLRTYDCQAYNKLAFFGEHSHNNKIDCQTTVATGHGLYGLHEWNILKYFIVDYGRGNYCDYSIKDTPYHIGTEYVNISKGPELARNNPVIQNALSGAGIWGSISSNVDFASHGISLRDVCRYPSEKTFVSKRLPYILSAKQPTENDPVEIVIDLSSRPVIGGRSYFIQFSPDYVASDYVVSFDTTNTGEFGNDIVVTDNTNITEFFDFPQEGSIFTIYRMKFRFTKPLQIANLQESMTDTVFNYNPDGLIGICNIGMPINDYAGRSFLGECGGSLYGNVDMHQNTLKNLPDPVDAGDAVNKAYLENYAKAEIKSYIDEAILGGAW